MEKLHDYLPAERTAAMQAATGRLRDLILQAGTLHRRLAEIEAALPALDAAAKAAEQGAQAATVRHGRGLASDDEVRLAAAARQTATAARDGARDELATLRAGRRNLEDETHTARQAAANARYALLDAAAAAIAHEIGADTKLRGRIKLMHAACAAIADPALHLAGGVQWDRIVGECLPEPEGAPAAAALAAVLRDVPRFEAPRG
jgi:hypothetical protein